MCASIKRRDSMTEGHPERHEVVTRSKIVGDYDASTHFFDEVAVCESRRIRPLLLRDWQVGGVTRFGEGATVHRRLSTPSEAAAITRPQVFRCTARVRRTFLTQAQSKPAAHQRDCTTGTIRE
jgi:hypothetical protein